MPKSEDVHLMMRQVDSATSQFQRSDEDMQEWYKSYYETIDKFYEQKPDLICPNPDELIDILDDLEKQIEKVSVQIPFQKVLLLQEKLPPLTFNLKITIEVVLVYFCYFH